MEKKEGEDFFNFFGIFMGLIWGNEWDDFPMKFIYFVILLVDIIDDMDISSIDHICIYYINNNPSKKYNKSNNNYTHPTI